MTTGGVFSLVVNDGKSDRMIHATKLLYQRIQDIMYMRTKQGRDDITPSLIDLERTHIIYVNAHFKPHAAIGFEYNKVMPNSGTTALGSSVTFSIPQFGDFFHDMVCRVRLDKATGNIGTLPTQSTSTDQTANIFPLNNGNYKYNIVDSDYNVLVAGVDASPTTQTKTYRNFVHYCEFPGNRLFTLVKFDVNGNPLDEYDQYVPVMLEKFTVPTTKRSGYNTLVGQQNVLQGVGNLHANKIYDADSNKPGQNQYGNFGATAYAANAIYNTPSVITPFDTTQSSKSVAVFEPKDVSNNLVVNTFPSANVASLSLSAGELTNTTIGTFSNSTNSVNKYNYDVSQNVTGYVNGFQTPKPTQPPLEVWNKLRFWYSEDVKLSIPSVSIPYGQRFITINLNEADNLLYEAPSIFLESIQQTNVLPSVATVISPITASSFANGSTGISLGVQATFTGVGLDGLVYSNSFNYTDAGHSAITQQKSLNLIQYGTSKITLGDGSAYQDITTATMLAYGSLSLPTAGDIFMPNTASISLNIVSTTATLTVFNATKGFIATFPITSPTYTSKPLSLTSIATSTVTQSTPCQQIKTYTPIFNKLGITAPKILNTELYVNNIFVNPEIHDIFIRRIGFALIRVYRQQKNNLTKATNEILLANLKWPIEYLFVGLQPLFNQKPVTTSNGVVTGGNINAWRDWHRMTRQLETVDGTLNIAEDQYHYSAVGKVSPYKYFNTLATVDNISVVSHGIKMYDSFSDTFFNNYQPYHYGDKITTPDDSGVFFINFALFPTAYQPSGHINISRARETYLNLNSSYCGNKTNCMAIIVAIAINFILISDGSCCLRYST